MNNDDEDNYTQRNLLIFIGALVGLVTTAIVVWAAWIGLNGDAAAAPAAASETQALEASAPAAASAGVKGGKKALVSGYHDSTGTLAVNEEVAKKRAFAVKEALVRLGVTEDQIELVKPQVSEGTGANAEARRVEVVLK